MDSVKYISSKLDRQPPLKILFGVLAPALIALALLLPSAVRASDDGKVQVSVSSSGFFSKKTVISVENLDIAPRAVKVSVFNGRDFGDLVHEALFNLEAKSREERQIQPLPGKDFAAVLSWRYKWALGRLPKQEKTNAFMLPFGSDIVRVCQSFDGPITTHKEKSYAVDFCAVEKVPIIASRDGLVLEVIDSFTEGGMRLDLLDKFNYIRLLHDDGLQTLYGHIFPKSANIAVGDRVRTGQLIGLVGSVGYSAGPHLHFEVSYLAEDFSHVVVNPQFLDNQGGPLKLAYGLQISNGAIYEAPKEKAPVETASANSRNELVGNDGLSPKTNIANSNQTPGQTLACAAKKGDAFVKAQECLLSRNYLEAERILSDLLNKNPSLARAHAMLGTSHAWQGNHEQAVGSFKKAFALGWTTYEAYVWHSRSLDALGHLDESIKYNRRALKRAPWLADVTGRLSEQLAAQGKVDEAIRLLEAFDLKQRKDGKKEFFGDRIRQLKDGG